MNIYFETLGCPKNFNDTEVAEGILENCGHHIVDNPYEADAIVVNTCGFINDAKIESIDKIFEMSSHDDKLLIVSGCLSQRYGDELFSEMPEVDLLIGVNQYENLPEILQEYKPGNREKRISLYEKELKSDKRKLSHGTYSATIKISEGCNNMCTYCVIPSIRGPYRSRSIGDIVTEASSLAKRGIKELILIGQDVTNYGIDIYGKYNLHELLEELVKIDDLVWIRLMYCYEDRITDELIEVINREEKICNYMDIPLQHISDNILESMKRHSTEKSIRTTLNKLREKIPDMRIRTTFIVGFPGETEEDFDKLYNFVRDYKFDRLGVFTYSQEEDTPAALMDNQIDEKVKEHRKDAIMNLQMQISNKKNRALIGKTLEVIVEEKDVNGEYIGRSRYDAPEIDNGVIIVTESDHEPGDIIEVKIYDAYDYDILGREI